MKILQLQDPRNPTYAHAGVLGTWTESHGICPRCSSSSQIVVPPLIIEWMPNGHLVGDFTWLGWAVVISSRAADLLSREFQGFELSDIEVRSGERPMKIIYPEDVRPLRQLVVVQTVIPLTASTIGISECPECGASTVHIRGTEQRVGDWDVENMKVVAVDRPRVAGQGLLVTAAHVVAAGIFGLSGRNRFVFCTETAKAVIEARGLTNCGFREVGETVS
jgi:hypothetical protein